jgi:hypothetical protein
MIASMNPARIVLGYLVAPLAVPLAFISIGALGGSFRAGDFSGILLLYGIFPYLMATLLFVPLILILRTAGLLEGVFFVLAGGVGGVAVALISNAFSELNLSIVLLMALGGGLSSLCFTRLELEIVEADHGR